jgi:hypothetical protein
MASSQGGRSRGNLSWADKESVLRCDEVLGPALTRGLQEAPDHPVTPEGGLSLPNPNRPFWMSLKSTGLGVRPKPSPTNNAGKCNPRTSEMHLPPRISFSAASDDGSLVTSRSFERALVAYKLS